MATGPIVTLTINPALDKSSNVARIVPDNKLRCGTPNFEAGGGGINVAKAIHRLGGNPIAIFTIGGPTGQRLHKLVKAEGVETMVIETKQWTRENLHILETSTGLQYRFGMPGTEMMPTEVRAILETMEEFDPKPSYIIASGSLPPGVPANFYGQIAEIAHKQGAKFIADTSGEALRYAAEAGVYLLKPNITELCELVGVDKLEMDEVDDAARALIIRGQCEVVIVSLGAMGAMLVTEDQVEHIPAPPVQPTSTVGAGDSMLAGIVWMLYQGKSYREAVRMGVACGSAATMNAGSELFKMQDVSRLLDWLNRYGKRYSAS
ncbi:1-phosphofructokinase family hexose kinase [Dyadobacter sandarakinus]|uniref:1-phosphofructokinase family hexose kinase n=1 Tax=Dyadobacter sandarakinus TaxID=2747268 RepID=A0ABX7IBM2_9BACT|nr:1-phosphofructokinase family hexose kinase [Dyadobacter sandarakinus]QRR03512.1 1-phosphofructokinase family hexose kinase [Dyadobacter sandarakinus]